MKAKKIVGWTMIAVGLLYFFSPMVYWVKNPELTQMQLFIECWWQFLGGLAMAVTGAFAAEINK